ncbi:hypothetical protein ACFVBP_21675 [Nocardioides sp. NPDC057764]|uniref:hypothetical protein n=1 Tax=Nocardioides sp. NPDC057764 TaxID=3346243 RepID=UPI003672E709
MRNTKPGPGRRSKGARKAFMTRLPMDLAVLVEHEAIARDISNSEYLALLTAQAHGIDVTMPARIVPVTAQSAIEEIDEELGQTA